MPWSPGRETSHPGAVPDIRTGLPGVRSQGFLTLSEVGPLPPGHAAARLRRGRLRQEHRQRLGRREQPLAVLGQQGLNIREQLRAGQQVEEAVGFGVLGMGEDAALSPRGGAPAGLRDRSAPGSLGASRTSTRGHSGRPILLRFPSVTLQITPFGPGRFLGPLLDPTKGRQQPSGRARRGRPRSVGCGLGPRGCGCRRWAGSRHGRRSRCACQRRRARPGPPGRPRPAPATG